MHAPFATPDDLVDAIVPDRFDDVYDAGERLADALARLIEVLRVPTEELVVAGVTEGGLPLAYVTSMALDLDVEAAPVEPVLAPHDRSIRIGMLVDDGTAYVDEQLGDRHGARGTTLDHLLDRAEDRLRAQMDALDDEPGAAIAGRTVLLVDDIVDSGTTAVAVTDWLRRWGARSVIVAAAVGTIHGMQRARGVADLAYCLVEAEEDIPPRRLFRRDPARTAIEPARLMEAIRAGAEDRRRRRSSAPTVG